jgi:hypothetical protein
VGHFDGLRARRSRDLREFHRALGDCPFRFVSGVDEAKNCENERIRFAKRNEGFRIAGRKSLKSLGAVNHDFAGSFIFNELSAISSRSFLACGSSVPKRNPGLKIKSPRSLRDGWRWADKRDQILQFRSIIFVFLLCTRNCSPSRDTERPSALCFDGSVIARREATRRSRGGMGDRRSPLDRLAYAPR